jgi:hypothetical protein
MDKFVLKLSEEAVYVEAGSLEELASALKTCPIACVKFHLRYGLNDFADWAGKSLKREDLALRLKQVKLSDVNPEETRRLLLDAIKPKPVEAARRRGFR